MNAPQLRQVRSAVLQCLASPEFIAMARLGVQHVADEVGEQSRFRYHFAGPRHAVQGWRECIARGYGACADAAAIVAAAAFVCRVPPASVSFIFDVGRAVEVDSYSHVVVAIADGGARARLFDPFSMFTVSSRSGEATWATTLERVMRRDTGVSAIGRPLSAVAS